MSERRWKTIDVALSLVLSSLFFSSSRLLVRPRFGLVYQNRETKKVPKEEAGQRSRAESVFVFSFDLDGRMARSIPLSVPSSLFPPSLSLTCTVLSGRSSPARRLMCSRRRRFESCSRIFLRAISRKGREKGKKEKVEEKKKRDEGQVRRGQRESELQKGKRKNADFTSTQPARPPWPP